MGYSTILVVVLCVQQLFSAYHVLNSHVNDCPIEISDGQTVISDIDVQCEICAKLNGTVAILDFDQHLSTYLGYPPLTVLSNEHRFASKWFKTIYQRGPPTSV